MRMIHAYVAMVLTLCLTSVALGQERIRMATTTSTENSGLLAVLLPPFEQKLRVKVDVIAVGTGKALKLGENGDVDLVFVHARATEEKFVQEGYGINRRDVMYNDFVVVGPGEDPANVQGMQDVAVGLKQIALNRSPFVSRGDESGTHKKEKSLWEVAGISPQGDWYMEVGQGMGPTLLIADQKRAYTVTDRGTYLAYRDKIQLPVLVEGDERLFNPYGIIAVHPAQHSHVKYLYAMALIGWVTSPEGQAIIRDFMVEGERLFHPMAIPVE